jgi:hypothetical protein
MTFTDLSTFLAENGLVAPDLFCLNPDNQNYSTILFQPGGSVEIRENYIGPGTNQVIRNQLLDFFRNAQENRINLAIIPEYSCPLQCLQSVIQDDILPDVRNLWVVGVEALTIQQLEHFKRTLGPTIKVIWEEGIETPEGKFLDPVFYIFQSQSSTGEPILVVVVQFKTEPMAEFTENEKNHMVRGTNIYVFNHTIRDKQRLTTLICSDSLSQTVQTGIVAIRDRCLIIHIQLNPDPRHDAFKLYRNLVFTQTSDQTEIICLNWSIEVQVAPPVRPNPFRSMCASGTAVYLKSYLVDRLDNDDLIRQNHRLGLYTTYWPDKHVFSFFFNFQPAVYHYVISKAFSLGNAVQFRRRGPIMSATLTWNSTTNHWVEAQGLPDNFSAVCADVHAHALRHLHCSGYDPLNTERLINLSIGFVGAPEWFRIANLRTHKIDDTEKIYCLTFAQERDPDVSRQRASNIGQFNDLQHIIEQRKSWPIWMIHIKKTPVLEYRIHYPHRNLFAPDGFTATVIYFGSHSEAALSELYQRLDSQLAAETLQRQGYLNAIAIWYHQNGEYLLYRGDVRPLITGDHTEFSADINRSPQ